MSTVSDVLAHKATDVLTIGIDATVFEAIGKMEERNVGSIVILDDFGELAGIFTERDYLRRIVLQNRTSKTTRVGEVMSNEVITAPADFPIEKCMDIMTEERIRHIPVIDKGRMIGIVSIGDLVKHLCQERSHEIKNLTDYITGRYPGEVGLGRW